MESVSYTGIILYTTIFFIYIFSLKASTQVGNVTTIKKDDIPNEFKVLGQFQFHFFTVWTFIFQIIFLLTAILDETSKLFNLPVPLQKRFGRARAFLFNTFVFPCSILVTTVFWTIWHIDRELIFPKVIDIIFPAWLNHVLHTFILVPLMIELALPKKYSFVQFSNASVILTVYAALYQLLYFSIYLRHGVWLYGIYSKLTWAERLLFTLFKLSLLLVYQKIGIAIQDTKRTKRTRKID